MADERLVKNWNKIVPDMLGPVLEAKVYQGSTIDAVLEARPDFDRQRWYWSCEFRSRDKRVTPKQIREAKKTNNPIPVPQKLAKVVKWGITQSQKEAQLAAEEAFRNGRD